MRDLRDLELAEDAVQEAVVAALATWPRDGVPHNPAAWLVVAARRFAIDRLRRGVRYEQKIALLQPLAARLTEEPQFDDNEIDDDQLALIFGCCHPALDIDAQVALTLRAVCGFSTADVARAFLVPESTMAQRLVRAKKKIRVAGVPFTVPTAGALLERTEAVLAVVYLIFNEGYSATAGDDTVRVAVVEEAIRLGRLVCRLLPDDPEAFGLTALMLLTDARRPARVTATGDLVPLEEQDRGLWRQRSIEEGMTMLGRAARLNDTGAYQLQAAIAAVHDQATDAASTNWASIVALYEMLLSIAPSPMVRLNHTVAISMARTPLEGLILLDESGVASTHYLALAARADMTKRSGDVAGAQRLYRLAAAAAPTGPEQRFLSRRADVLARVGR